MNIRRLFSYLLICVVLFIYGCGSGGGGEGSPTGVMQTVIWQGTLASAPADPNLNWTYYNSVDKKSYIWDGAVWQTLAVDGTVGPQGPAGISLTWQGTLATAPANPSLNWAYFNSADSKSYIWNGTTWAILAESIAGPAGPQGTAGISTTWQGTLTAHPSNPQLNWAYYNSLDGKSYIWDGTVWQTLTQPANNGVVPASIVCGGSFSMALTSNGFVYSWGSNSRGQLADGTTTDRNFPALIQGLSGVTSMDAGGEHALFLKGDHSVWAVGGNQSGQLGDTTNTDQTHVKRINIDLAQLYIYDVSCGLNQSFFSDSQSINSNLACGDSLSGQFSNGNTLGLNSTAQVCNQGWAPFVGGNQHSVYSQWGSGSLFSSGNNSKGQLGDGTWANSTVGVPVSGAFNATKYKTFFNHTMAAKALCVNIR